jgi:predicted MFS family arabinose efflux permease
VRTRFTDLFAPLKYRDFRLLWFAQVFSEVGDWAGRLALAVVVAEKTHSTLLTALVTSASVLPYIGIGQLLAAYVNRFPRRTTIIVTDLGRAALFATLAIEMPVAMILVLAFVAGCLTPPFEAARNALTPLSVPRDRYGDAIALASITFDLAVLFGYGAGGVLLTVVGARLALLLNAGSFLISAALLGMIPAARERIADGPPVRVRDGWRTIVDDPFIRRYFVSYTIVGACAVVGESLVALYALQVLFEDAGASGLLAAAIPIGAIIAAVLARSHGDDTRKLRRASAVALIGSSFGIAVFVSAPEIPGILVGFAAIGALNASRIPGNEVSVIRMDDRVRGPAITVLNGFMLGGQAIAAGVGGLIARSIGVRQTIVLSLVLSAIVAAWGTLRPPHELRHAIRTSTTPR